MVKFNQALGSLTYATLTKNWGVGTTGVVSGHSNEMQLNRMHGLVWITKSALTRKSRCFWESAAVLGVVWNAPHDFLKATGAGLLQGSASFHSTQREAEVRFLSSAFWKRYTCPSLEQVYPKSIQPLNSRGNTNMRHWRGIKLDDNFSAPIYGSALGICRLKCGMQTPCLLTSAMRAQY